jgi:hypothetical protein
MQIANAPTLSHEVCGTEKEKKEMATEFHYTGVVVYIFVSLIHFKIYIFLGGKWGWARGKKTKKKNHIDYSQWNRTKTTFTARGDSIKVTCRLSIADLLQKQQSDIPT